MYVTDGLPRNVGKDSQDVRGEKSGCKSRGLSLWLRKLAKDPFTTAAIGGR